MYGDLVEAGDVNELSLLLDEYVASPERSQRFVKLGYQRIVDKFNQSASVSKLLKLICNNGN